MSRPIKVCGFCGSCEDVNWKRHWESHFEKGKAPRRRVIEDIDNDHCTGPTKTNWRKEAKDRLAT
jgi:hypothetical protein